MTQPDPGALSASRPAPQPLAFPRRASRPPSVRRAVFRFMLTSLGAIVVLAVAAVYLQQRIGERAAIRTARESAALISRGIVEPVLTERQLARHRPRRARSDHPNPRARPDERPGQDLGRGRHHPLLRRAPADRPEVPPRARRDREPSATGSTAAGISDLSAPENRLERRDRRLLEVYRPVHVAPTGRVVLFEVYKRFDEASVSTLRVWRTSALALLGAVALIWLLQVPLAVSLARRLRAGHEERERLLQRAVNASNIERGRIASDLHDGVVPQLAGTAYTLAAAARSAGSAPPRRDREHDGRECRHGARRDPAAALADRGDPPATAGERGTGRRPRGSRCRCLRVRPRDRGRGRAGSPPPGRERAAALPCRAGGPAQHRRPRAGDATRHSRSNRTRSAWSSWSPTTGSVSRGELAQRRASGHLGLELLAELAADAGGQLEMESQPGIGTTLRLRMPGR